MSEGFLLTYGQELVEITTEDPGFLAHFFHYVTD